MVNRIKMTAIGLTLLAVFVLTACGQKRALYLPEEPTLNNTQSDAAPSTEPDEQGED